MASICIFGAGSIGCYVGGRLGASGAAIQLIGRPRIAEELGQHGLHLSDYRGDALHWPAEAVRFSTATETLNDAELVLVTVKSAATTDTADILARHLRPGALVISFQNGLGNAAILAKRLPKHQVLAGMVPFNVVHQGQGRFHQGSEGSLEVAASSGLAPFLPAFKQAGLPLLQHADMQAVLWAKLLLNLNNAINALCGQPLKQELSQRDFRRCLALAQREALHLMQIAGIRPARLTPLPPGWIPSLLGAPNVLFHLLANKMLAIDPEARSSMWEDLENGRATEIDWLNGEVLRLAESLRTTAPVNAHLIALIRAAERGGRRDWTGPELYAQLRRLASSGRPQPQPR